MRNSIKDSLSRFFAAIIGLVLGVMLTYGGQVIIKNQIADGEITCERIHKQLICWNPKEEQK